jgi:hypothetical protein
MSYSGLFEAQQGEDYIATVPKARKPQMLNGIVRVFMQKQGMHGVANALGRNTPAVIEQVNTQRGTIAVPGTFTYGTRTVARDVNISNAEPGYDGLSTRARPANPTEAALVDSIDTTQKTGYVKDDADLGVTSPAVAEVIGA